MDWTWDLSVLYKDFDDPQIEKDFDRLKEICEQSKNAFEGDALTVLEKAADSMEEIQRLASALGSFANLTLATDANNERAQQLMDRVMVFSVQLSLLNSSLVRYIGGVEDLDALIARSEKLRKIDFFLRHSKEEAAHLMDPAIEE